MKTASGKSRSASSRVPIKSQAVILLGMHRSGTSACTRVLNLLGCALPGTLIGPADGNELGHWETSNVVSLNDEILASAGSSWADWGPINEDWRMSALRDEMVDRAIALVEEHAALGPLFALKDPRMCRLADVWLEAMDAADVDPRVILMVRNPAEVAASLDNRDLMTPGYSQLLWLRHVLDAEYFSRDRRRIVCTYDQLMSNWYGVIDKVKKGLAVALPRNAPAVHDEVERFLSGEQRHSVLSAEMVLANPGVSVWLRRTFAIMLAWSEQPEDAADYAELDEIRNEFDRAYAAFARLLLPTGASGEFASGSQLKRELAAQIAGAQQATDAAQIALEETEAMRVAIAAREVELVAQADAGAAHAEQLQGEIDSLRAEAEQLRISAAEAVQAAAIEADAQRATAAAREADITAQMDAAQVRSQTLQTVIEGLRAESEVFRAQGHKLATERATIETTLAAVRTDAERELQQRLDVEGRLAETAAKLFEQSVQRAELAGRVAAAESALIQRQEELAQVWSQLLAAEKARVIAEAVASQAGDRRLELEQRVAATESEAADLLRQVAEVRATPAPVPDHLYAEIAQLTRLLHDQETGAQRALAAQAGAEAALARRGDEIDRLTQMLQAREEKAQDTVAALSVAEHELANQAHSHQKLAAECERQQVAVRVADAARAATEQKLSARFDEIARLTAFLADEGGKARIAGEQADWLLQMTKLAQGFPKWWALMPQDWRQKREHRRYRKAGLFDAASYLETYPDVASDGMDPVRHYVLHGMAEGRQRPL